MGSQGTYRRRGATFSSTQADGLPLFSIRPGLSVRIDRFTELRVHPPSLATPGSVFGTPSSRPVALCREEESRTVKRTFTRLAAIATVGTALAFAPDSSLSRPAVPVMHPHRRRGSRRPAAATHRHRQHRPRCCASTTRPISQGQEITREAQAYVKLGERQTRQDDRDSTSSVQQGPRPGTEEGLQEQALADSTARSKTSTAGPRRN